MKNILITGGAGFVGSRLAYRLIKEGDHIILLDNMSYGRDDNLVFEDVDLHKNLIVGDIRDKKLVCSILKDNNIEYVFHFAGIAPLPDCQSNPAEAVDVNVSGTVNVLECSRLLGVKKIVFASSNAIYENVDEFPTKEDFKSLPTLIYPNTKYAAERFCESFCKTYGMSITCLRFANVYGPHIDCLRKQPPFVGYMIRELFFNRSPIFYSDGNQRRDYIFVDDLVDLAVMVLSKENGFETINVSSKQNYSVKELYQITCTIMKKSIAARYAPSISYWSKYPSLYGGSYSIKESILNHEVNKLSLCDNSKAKSLYNWEPKTNIVDGLSQVVKVECLLLQQKNERK